MKNLIETKQERIVSDAEGLLTAKMVTKINRDGVASIDIKIADTEMGNVTDFVEQLCEELIEAIQEARNDVYLVTGQDNLFGGAVVISTHTHTTDLDGERPGMSETLARELR